MSIHADALAKLANQQAEDAAGGEETTEGAAPAGEATEADTTGTEGGAPAGEPGAGEGEAPGEAAPSAEPTAEETAAAEAAGDAAADALGDDATEEEKEAARTAAEEQFYVGTYKDKDSAEAGLAEKDATIERLFTERNQLNQRLQEAQEVTEAAKEPEQLDVGAWHQWAEAAVSEGAGQEGALAALREGGHDGYQVYLQHWLAAADEEGEADAKARAAAVVFNNQYMLEVAEVRAAAAAQRERDKPSAADSRAEAHAIVKAKRPDLDEYADEMAKVVTQLPLEEIERLRTLAQSGVQGQADALERVYLEARLQVSGSKQAAAAAEQKRRKVSADAATLDATTSSSEGTTSRTPPPATEAYGQQRKRELRERQGLTIEDDL